VERLVSRDWKYSGSSGHDYGIIYPQGDALTQ
jgi:hypothetical protein